MHRWVTCESTTFESMVNPLAGACSEGFVPDEYIILSNEAIRDNVERATALAERIVAEYDESLETTVESLDDERDLEAIVSFFKDNLDAPPSGETAVDVTPGRKFMSAIAFQAGMQYGADHVYYLFLDSADYYGHIYDDIPDPAVDLIDFTAVMP
ncbi:hypothetical protein G9C85_09370 [Halorubellus sp. JP-L1]|uniref:hypothetical protein n=1 Tax=Halorubellus sp. JP-L1 TaxID=2715753 RepID=UPI00140917F3|nr:hypothetical protein [Halorubellus sp. JP-L1]NHN41838.1 hypothetical protein [Halorubellus sp. JP-L1]